MMGPHEREGSLSFSLAELSRLEGERLREQEERGRRLRAAQAEAESLARRQRQEREAEESRALEEQRVEQHRRSVENAARLDAMHQAALLRAKTEAEAGARTALEELEHRHVEALARIREVEGVSEWKRIAAASWAFAGVSCLAALVVVLAIVRPDAARRVAPAEAGAAAQSEELRGTREREADGESRLRALGVRLDEETRHSRDLAIALDAQRAAALRPKGPRGTPGVPTHPPVPPSGPFGTNCPPGSMDPLCGLSK
jgi:hypothetical protein